MLRSTTDSDLGDTMGDATAEVAVLAATCEEGAIAITTTQDLLLNQQFPGLM